MMKNTTLRQLTVFEVTARHLHFTRAAQELRMTQPSVSIQIRQLEENLGVVLFEQIGKKMHLTEAGRELHRFCLEIQRQMNEAETVLARLKGLQGGELRLAIGPSAKYFVPKLLAVFSKNYPEVAIDLNIASHESLLAQLSNNERDMVIMGMPPGDETLTATPFLSDPLVVIAPPQHALADARGIPLAGLAQEPFLIRESSSATRAVIEEFFARKQLAIRTFMTINSNEAIKQCVQAGLGVAIVPLQSVVQELIGKRLVVLDFVSLPLQRSWYLVHRKEKFFSHVAEAFRNFVLEQAARYVDAEERALNLGGAPLSRDHAARA